jgi:Organic radical activating enzymes
MYYPVKVLGPGCRVGIWLNGCRKNCPGCISPEMQQYDPTKEVAVNDIISMVSRIEKPIDGFTISGGEPFYNPKALNALVVGLSPVNDDILIFTGYTLAELKEQENTEINSIIETCAAIIDGPYIRELHDGTGLKGSSNQHCWIFKHQDRYAGIEKERRSIQNIMYDKGILAIGIP